MDSKQFIDVKDVVKFISANLPDVEVFEMEMPVTMKKITDDVIVIYLTENWNAGFDTYSQEMVLNNCITHLKERIEKKKVYSVGIYGLFSIERLDQENIGNVVLRYALPKQMNTKDEEVEDAYEPKFTKQQEQFEYRQGDVIKRLEEKNYNI